MAGAAASFHVQVEIKHAHMQISAGSSALSPPTVITWLLFLKILGTGLLGSQGSFTAAQSTRRPSLSFPGPASPVLSASSRAGLSAASLSIFLYSSMESPAHAWACFPAMLLFTPTLVLLCHGLSPPPTLPGTQLGPMEALQWSHCHNGCIHFAALCHFLRRPGNRPPIYLPVSTFSVFLVELAPPGRGWGR